MRKSCVYPYNARQVEAAVAKVPVLRLEIVKRSDDMKGFVVLPRRWVVERSFGWLTHWGGLLRERAGRLDVAAARLACAAGTAGTTQPTTGSRRRLRDTQTGS